MFHVVHTIVSDPNPVTQRSANLGLVVLRPRRYLDPYHILEGSSMIFRAILHPDLFPQIRHILFDGSLREDENTWLGFFQLLILDLFEPTRKPAIVDSFDRHVFPTVSNACNDLLVVMRKWRATHLLPEYTAVDLLRAAAYRRANIRPMRKVMGENRLTLLVLNRETNRLMLNVDQVVHSLRENFLSEMNVLLKKNEEESPSQLVNLFAGVDILVATYGSDLTNALFMLPQSAVVEVFQPFWYNNRYELLMDDFHIMHWTVSSKGEKGPECIQDPHSKLCLTRGIRDRNFDVTIQELLEVVKLIPREVWSKKYNPPFFPVFCIPLSFQFFCEDKDYSFHLFMEISQESSVFTRPDEDSDSCQQIRNSCFTRYPMLFLLYS